MKVEFLVHNNSVLEVFNLDNGDFVTVGDKFKAPNSPIFDNKEDAMYFKLLRSLEKGKPISNFKSSKYYKYYIERLKKENPEYII